MSVTTPAPVLDPVLVRRATTAAAEVCEALAQPPPDEVGDDVSPTSIRWRDQALSKGAPGIALLHGIRAQHGLGDRQRVHAWLSRAVRDDLSAAPSAGLWFGAPAVAYAIHTAAPGGYRAAMTDLDMAVGRLTRTRLHVAAARIDAGRRPVLSEFDLVRGLTGLGAYHLRRHPDDQLLKDVLAYLVRLTEPLPGQDAAGQATPGWWTADPPAGLSSERFPAGHADLGMAHGISGPLALLSLAMRHGVTVAGHGEAIDQIRAWLTHLRQDSPTGPWWPERVGLQDLHTGRSIQDGPARPSWCYGTPGISRALQLAAIARHDRPAQQAAEHALTACLSDPAQTAHIRDLSICHGWAGVIATAHVAAADAITTGNSDHLPRLLDTLIDQTIHADTGPSGLIDGAAGAALTLHTIATAATAGWATCLLLT